MVVRLWKLTGFTLLSMAALVCCSLTSAQDLVTGVRYSVEVKKSFDTVVEDVEFAITEHNFRITGSNRVGEVIGERHGIAFPHSVVIHFCNLEYAKQLLEIDANYLLHMPCKIAVREEGARVVVETVLLPDDPRVKTVSEVNTILRAIANYAAD